MNQAKGYKQRRFVLSTWKKDPARFSITTKVEMGA